MLYKNWFTHFSVKMRKLILPYCHTFMSCSCTYKMKLIILLLVKVHVCVNGSPIHKEYISIAGSIK